MRILSPTLPCLPQAFITNTSFTAVHAMVSTPFALIWSASSTKPGRCLASQVGVKAPGTENSTTVLPPKSCSVVIFCGPSLVMRVNAPSGILSPALIVILFPYRLRSELVRIQLPQLEHSGAHVRDRLEFVERLLCLSGVLQRDLRAAEIHVGLVHLLDLSLAD